MCYPAAAVAAHYLRDVNVGGVLCCSSFVSRSIASWLYNLSAINASLHVSSRSTAAADSSNDKCAKRRTFR
eukprot:7310-Heterococcus_DN1.PRE.3